MLIGVESRDFGLNFDVAGDLWDVDGPGIDLESCLEIDLDRFDIPDLLIHTVHSLVDKAEHTRKRITCPFLPVLLARLVMLLKNRSRLPDSCWADYFQYRH